KEEKIEESTAMRKLMRIGIDATTIGLGLSGVSRAGVYRYLLNIVSGLAEIDEVNDYVLFLSLFRSKHLKGYHEVRSLFDGRRNFGIALSRLPRRISVPLRMPTDLYTGRVDVFHGDVLFAPVTSGKYVITIHDMAYLRMPEILDPEWVRILSNNTGFSAKKLKWYRDRVKLFEDLKKYNPPAVRKADLVIAVSSSTKNDLVELLHVPKDKVKVVHNGVTRDFAPIRDKELLAETRRKYNIKGDYILFVSELRPYKNIAGLLEAFNELRQSSNIRHKLVITGTKSWYYDIILQRVRELQLEEDLIFTDFVPDEDLPALYSGADLFVFPSLFEGFGIDVLEAMACSTPVVSSNAASLPEVVGDAGILVNPHSSEDMAEGMHRVLSDTALRAKLCNKGIERAKLFTWEKAARKTLDAYKEVCRM
ncbi:MAG: glycosyltransferase family 4 protein, partial [Candidatus Hydrothermarchaeales archaeon]